MVQYSILSSCRPSDWPFYFGMVAPFALVYVFNWSLFTCIMSSLSRRIYKHKKESGISFNHDYRNLLFVALSLSVMFGLGWIFGLIASVPTAAVSIASQYIFSICIGLQGVFIFILHGVRSQDARRTWRRWFYRIFCCNKVPEYLLTMSSPSNTLGRARSKKKKPSLRELGLQRQKNPPYESQELHAVFSDVTGSTMVPSPQYEKPQPPTDDFPDIDIGEPLGIGNVTRTGNVTTFINPDALSYTSETLQLEFREPVPEASEDDENQREFTLDLKDLDNPPSVVESRYQYSLSGGANVVIANSGADVSFESHDHDSLAAVASTEADTKPDSVRVSVSGSAIQQSTDEGSFN